jgi:hypothetical protein
MSVRPIHRALSLALLLLSLAGLSSGAPATPQPVTPVPKVINRASGAAQAKRDLAAGKVQLLMGGGVALYAPEVPANDPRFARIPRSEVPNGCTAPHAPEWFEFAAGYNAVIVDSVRKQGGH